MTLHPYRATCPIGRKMSEPCPMQRHQEAMIECASCLAEWEERAAIIADGCRLTQPLAEAEATRQLLNAVSKAENKQGRLF